MLNAHSNWNTVYWFFSSQKFSLQTIWYANRSIWQFFLKFANSAFGDKHDGNHFPHTKINMAIFSKVVEQIEFVNWCSTIDMISKWCSHSGIQQVFTKLNLHNLASLIYSCVICIFNEEEGIKIQTFMWMFLVSLFIIVVL